MNATDHARGSPTLIGVFADLYFILIGFIEDVILFVLAAVTARNLFLLFLIVVSVYIARRLWNYLCEVKSVHLTVSYVSAVKAWREMCRMRKEMKWGTVVKYLLTSLLYTVSFFIHMFMFLFWGCYCFLGSIFTQLDTYTEAQVATELKVKNSVDPSEPGASEAVARMNQRRAAPRAVLGRGGRIRMNRTTPMGTEGRCTVDTTEIQEEYAPTSRDLRDILEHPNYMEFMCELGRKLDAHRKRRIEHHDTTSDTGLEQAAEDDDNPAAKKSKVVAMGKEESMDDGGDSD